MTDQAEDWLSDQVWGLIFMWLIISLVNMSSATLIMLLILLKRLGLVCLTEINQVLLLDLTRLAEVFMCLMLYHITPYITFS